mmetsp:Transcript_13338/g.15291  ORF Transcript_13338/g.15291 Transcript_13338/m.15291 type:complete len:216 (+) Transcript_13338:36-683(+)
MNEIDKDLRERKNLYKERVLNDRASSDRLVSDKELNAGKNERPRQGFKQQPEERKAGPYFLRERFVKNHSLFYLNALEEIQKGMKRGCWLWFILPTPPYIVDGVERGSIMNKRFALRGDDCAKAYLQYEDKGLGVNLRANYLGICLAIILQMRKGNTLTNMFSSMDTPKVVSSLTLFQRIALDMDDEELYKACCAVLKPSKSRASKYKSKRQRSW